VVRLLAAEAREDLEGKERGSFSLTLRPAAVVTTPLLPLLLLLLFVFLLLLFGLFSFLTVFSPPPHPPIPPIAHPFPPFVAILFPSISSWKSPSPINLLCFACSTFWKYFWA